MSQNQERQPNIKGDILLRVRVLYYLFFALGILILGRIVWIQFFSEEIATNSVRIEEKIFREGDVMARRGNIYARNGEPLATSIFRYRVRFDMAAEGFDSLRLFKREADSLAELLSLHFGDRSKQEYFDLMMGEHTKRYKLSPRGDSTYYRSSTELGRWWDRVWNREKITRKLYDTLRDTRPVAIFPRDVDYAEWRKLRTYPILNWSLGWVYRDSMVDRRVYPHGDLAARTITNAGSFGIEDIYSQALAGQGGKEKRQRIAHGFSVRVPNWEGSVEAVDGADIYTTIDLDIQDVADKALRRQLDSQRAFWGTTVVMECQTGDILAMANLGRKEDGSYAELENYALHHRAEPGSTFKLASTLALIEDCNFDLAKTYDTEDGKTVNIGGADVRDSHEGGHVETLKSAFAESYNVWFVKAIYEAYKDNPKRFTDFLRRLHLGEVAGLEEYGHRAPYLPEPGKKGWWGVTLQNLAYGYGLELTPMHVLTLYNMVANNGVMVAPRLVSRIEREGEIVEQIPVRVLADSVCSQSTLKIVRELLEEVAISGTASYYFKDRSRFSVGAKTGTATYAQSGITYDDRYYLGSMVTYLPAERPRYIFITSMLTQKGRGSSYYGATLAGPVQKQVATYLSTLLDEEREQISEPGTKRPQRVKGGDAESMLKVADHYQIGFDSPTKRGWVTSCCDSLQTTYQQIDTESGVVPNVVGMGLKDALYLLESSGLKVRFEGAGSVVSQHPEAGAKLSKGGVAYLKLKN